MLALVFIAAFGLAGPMAAANHSAPIRLNPDGAWCWFQDEQAVICERRMTFYVKYASNGEDTVHFAFTEAHPQRPLAASLFHACYRRGGLYTSDGQLVRKLADGPISAGGSDSRLLWIQCLHRQSLSALVPRRLPVLCRF